MLRTFGVALATGLLISSIANASSPTPPIGLGSLESRDEINRYDITIYPDGRGLPTGKGTSAKGKMLFQMQCAACHGQSGTEGPATRMAGNPGPLNLKNPFMALSVGGMWPYATTIFDYIRRAMPHNNSKSLTNDQSYALTAYILYLNDLIEEDQAIDATTLPSIRMPALESMENGWEQWRSQGR